MNVPSLRFTEFEDSLKLTKLNEILVLFGGNAFQSKDATSDGIRWLKISNVGFGKIEWEAKSFLPLTYIKEYKKYILSEGDIVMALTRPIINGELKIAIITESDSPSVLNQRVAKIICKDFVNSKFVYHLLRQRKVVTEIGNLISGTDPPNVGNSEMKKINITIPDEKEQQKIGYFFTLFDEKIKKQQEKIVKLEELKKGMMQKIFSQEIRFKDEDGGEFREWESFLFGNIVSNKSDKVNPEDGSDFNMCIELENIESGSGRLIKDTNYVDQTSMKNKFSRGSVLFGKLRPYLRKYWFSDSEGMCSTEIWVLSPRVSSLKKKFLYYFIQTEYFMEFANKSSGSKMPRADWNIISNTEIMIPTIKEQQKISTFFSTLDHKIENEKHKIDSLKKQKKGFMQQMFI